MPTWDQIYSDLKQVERRISEGIQELNISIRALDVEGSGAEQLEQIKNRENVVQNNLKRYNELLRDMETCVSRDGIQGHRSLLARSRDVYKDFSTSFRLAKSNASRKVTRAELFSGRQEEYGIVTVFAYPNRKEEDSETQLLLKEMTSTSNSIRMADSYLENAMDAHASLRQQSKRLQKSKGTMAAITNRFPTINNLTSSVFYKKNRDNIIVGVFIAICICFCIWYVSR